MERKRDNASSRCDVRAIFLVLIVLALLGGSAALVPVVRDARERARWIPSVRCLRQSFPGLTLYDVSGSGCPQWRVERGLHEALASIAVREHKDARIGLRVHTCRITAEALQALDNCEGNLVAISLANVELAPSSLHHVGQLHSLRYLDLTNTGIGDPELLDLKHLARLREVDVSGNNVTNAGIAALQAALPDCTVRSSQ